MTIATPGSAHQSPVRERRATEFAPPTTRHQRQSDPAQQGLDTPSSKPSIIIRKLPRNTGQEGIRNLLLFAKDLVAVRLIDALPEDAGHSTAVAHFQTLAGAREARESLDGKPNATQDARLIVELPSTDYFASRRGTVDGTTSQRNPGVTSAGAGGTEQRSRFSSAFQTDKISPPLPTPSLTGDGDSSTHIQSLFSPTSPMGKELHDGQHNSGKSMINDDAADDETDGLLSNPLAYVRDGRHSSSNKGNNSHSRPLITQMPTMQFGALSLHDTGTLSPPHSGLVSPTGNPASYVQHPKLGHHHGGFSSGNMNNTSNAAGRTSYPPANPADQNPPCNTLYVGNLPNNTSEDELKRLFSLQRGYKRLCFRTKQNGPMCFVEFESITLATQALHHLYGKMLSNSVKGGIRLSFSKNPLGVRNGQAGLPPNGIGMGMGMGMNNNHVAFNPGGAGGVGAGPVGSAGSGAGFGNLDLVSPPPGFASLQNGSGPAGPPPPGISPGARGGDASIGGRSYGRTMTPGGNGAVDPVLYQAHAYSMSGAPFASQLRMPIMYHPHHLAMQPQQQPQPPQTQQTQPDMAQFNDSSAR